MEDYTKEFLEAWKAYGNPKNSSKTLAYKRWQSLNGSRPLQDLLIAEINCYNQWLSDQTSKNGREYPKCHMATWLSQKRFESFEDDARAVLRAREASPAPDAREGRSWLDGPWQVMKTALIAENRDYLPGAIYEGWFRKTVFSGIEPVEIVSPSKFHRDELEKRFGKIIRKAFGEDTILSVMGQR